MFIDYLALMLINLVAGLVLLAVWTFLDLGSPQQRRWLPGLLMVGIISLFTGLHMIFTWPLPGAYNIPYGEMSVFFGILMLGLSLTLLFDISLLSVSIYATLVGLASILTGIQVINLGMTESPVLTGTSFIWMGVIGLLTLPMLRLQEILAARVLGAVGLLAAAVLWGAIGYVGYWHHLESSFQIWKPLHMEYQIHMNTPRANSPAAAPSKAN